jgi:hypothetical protein
MRISSGNESTIGALYINGEFACFTLEDTKRIKKVHGETRIPDGLYTLDLRNEGRLTEKYANRYGDMHRGMLWLKDVPGFDWIYIHTGNKRGHTEGCILVGDTLNNNEIGDGFIGKSREAYTRIYPRLAQAIESGEEVRVHSKITLHSCYRI